jgi:hypothetical protein
MKSAGAGRKLRDLVSHRSGVVTQSYPFTAIIFPRPKCDPRLLLREIYAACLERTDSVTAGNAASKQKVDDL